MAEVIDPLDVARQMYEDYPPGFPFDNFDVAELILPDGDDMGIPSEDEEGDEEQLETETGFGSVIGTLGGTDRAPRACIQRCSILLAAAVVDNLPVVPEEKYEKLVNVLKKIYGQIGTVRDGGWTRTSSRARSRSAVLSSRACAVQVACTCPRTTTRCPRGSPLWSLPAQR